MNKLFSVIISFTLVVFVNTKAKCDHLILNGDTSYIEFSQSPLEKYPFIEALRPQLATFHATCYDCGCFKYDAEWSVINNELYLTNIYGCPNSNEHLKADINTLFNVRDGKVKAGWVNDGLWMPKGKPVGVVSVDIFYQAELYVLIVNGKVEQIKEFNYPDSRETIYARNEKACNEFIYSNINWAKIPDLGEQVKRVNISCETGASGKPENIKVAQSTNETLYNDEAVRVIGLLPWSILYSRGKIYKQPWALRVIFSEENRKKYAR